MGRDVAEQTAALANHLQQTAASHEIVLVNLEVLGQFLNPLRQNSHLRGRAAGIILVRLRALDSRSFLLSCDHVYTHFIRYTPLAQPWFVRNVFNSHA